MVGELTEGWDVEGEVTEGLGVEGEFTEGWGVPPSSSEPIMIISIQQYSYFLMLISLGRQKFHNELCVIKVRLSIRPFKVKILNLLSCFHCFIEFLLFVLT